MNQAEIEAVWQNNIPWVDRLFYHYLRDVVSDYATKTVGVRCAIRQSTIAAAFEFVPERGSKLPPIKLTNKQVEKMCSRAVERGWISRRFDHLGHAIPMQFRLELVDFSSFRSNNEGGMRGEEKCIDDGVANHLNYQLNSNSYPNQTQNIRQVKERKNKERKGRGRGEEGEWKGSGRGVTDGELFNRENQENTKDYNQSCDVEGEMKGSVKNTYEGGISSISSNNSLSNTREGVSAISVDNFQIDDLLINRLRLSGVQLSLPENREQLQLALVKFQSSEKYFSQLKPIDHWRKLFVGYCASWSANSSRGHYAKSSQKSESSQQAVRSAILSGSRRNFVDIN